MSDNIKIVPVAEEYIEGVRDTLDVVARERKYLSFLVAPSLESSREFIGNIIKNDCAQFVALSGDKVIGWCDVLPEEKEITKHVGVMGVGVLPEFRGKGIGRRLIETTLDKAKSQGITRIELWVFEDNKKAFELYKRMGFEVEGLKRNAIKIDGVYKNEHIMAMLIEE